jgi:TP901 family phage tail tape measure protein
MASVLEIIVRARDEASAVLQRVGGAVQTSSGRLAGLKAGLDSVGGAMMRTVTPAAAGLAVVLGQAGNEWAQAVRTFGATGKELQGLLASTRKVAASVPQPLSQVAEAMDEINDRTGLAGAPLERLTRRFLDLERITGEAASSTIPAITRLFGDWSVRTRDQSEVMDQLFRASEATGIGVADLAGKVQSFGAPLRQLGFSLTETAAMFAGFERAGVNTAAVMPGLRMALKNLAAPSDDLAKTLRRVGVTAKEPKEAFDQLLGAIKDAPSDTKATALALKVFGSRAGPALASAIREGKLDFAGLVKEIEGGKGSIKATADETRSFGDRLAMLRNRITGILGPFGQVGSVIAGGVASIGPFLLGLSQLIGVLGNVRLATLAAFGIWALIGVAVVAVVVLIIRNWDKVKAFLLKVWEALKAAWSRVWEAIKAVAFRVWEAIRRPVSAFVEFVHGVISGYLGFWRRAWDAAVSVVRTVWEKIKGIWRTAKGWFGDLFGGIKQLAIDAWNGIVDTVKRIWNGLASLWNRGPGSWRIGFPSWVPGLGGKGWDVPDLPYLAKGGIVTRPMIAMIGEAGPEAVIPLRALDRGPKRLDVRVYVDRRRVARQMWIERSYGGWR